MAKLVNKDGDELRICTNCVIHHYENCTTCFGFGLEVRPYFDTPVPVLAGEAHDLTFGPFQACPECFSTPAGLN